MNRRMMTTVLAAAASVVMLWLVAPAQGATFLGLGDLPGGFYSSANGVSANGSVVVGQGGNSAPAFQAFRWTSGGGIVGLGDLTGGGFGSNAYGVSADGSVVVGGGSSASGFEAFRWTSGGGMIGLGDLPGGSFNSVANGVSADGAVIVGSSESALGTEAFRWTSGGMVGLGALYGGSFGGSSAKGASAGGAVVVGSSSTNTSGTEAFRWTSGGGMVGLGFLPDTNVHSSTANGVSADGAVVVGQGTSASGLEAFRWTSGGGMVGLGDLPGGGFSSTANGVSADGAVVVGQSESASGGQAFVWDAANQMRNIRDVLAPSVGAALTGWYLQSATAVSADGRIVVGYGTDPNGNTQAWLANLSDQSGQTEWSSEASGHWDSTTNWQFLAEPIPTDDVIIDPVAALTVTGPTANRTVNTLQLGGSGVARATLCLDGAAGGDLNVVSYAAVAPDGELVLAGGRSFVTPVLYNSGLIRGTGTIDAYVVNYPEGEVRVAAGDSLVVSPYGIDNQGLIEATTGSLEFIGLVTNHSGDGLITSRGATLRFQDGLANEGAMAIVDGSNGVHGDIMNNAGAKITVTGGASAVFYDDVVQNGTLRVIKVGSTTSTAVFLGSYSGAGTTGGGDIFMEGDLRPGNSPASVTFGNNVALGGDASINIELAGTTPGSQYDQVHVSGQLALDGVLKVSLLAFNPLSGQSFNILDWGSLSGTFAALALPSLAPGLSWNTSQLYTAGVLSIGQPGDFNANGIVDAADYVVWRKRNGSQTEYNTWRSNYGRPPVSGNGSAAGIQAAVPEPASAWLLIVGTVVAIWRGRRIASHVPSSR